MSESQQFLELRKCVKHIIKMGVHLHFVLLLDLFLCSQVTSLDGKHAIYKQMIQAKGWLSFNRVYLQMYKEHHKSSYHHGTFIVPCIVIQAGDIVCHNCICHHCLLCLMKSDSLKNLTRHSGLGYLPCLWGLFFGIKSKL